MPNFGSFLATSRSNKLPSVGVGNATTESIFNGSDSNQLQLAIEGSGVLNMRPFRVRVWGRTTGGTTTNVTIALYLGTNATFSNNTKLATTGAVACNSTSGNFFLETYMLYDTTSNKIQGYFWGFSNGVAVSPTVQSAAVTGFSDTAEGQGLTVTALFSATNAGNTAFIDGFELIPE